MKISRVGVDLAKSVFQIHGSDAHGKAIWKRKLTREKMDRGHLYKGARWL
jgi:transposase